MSLDSLTFQTLFASLAQIIPSDQNSIQIASGFPPVRKANLDPDALVSSVIANGEVVVVSIGKDGSLGKTNSSTEQIPVAPIEAASTNSEASVFSGIERAGESSTVSDVARKLRKLDLYFSDETIATAVDICGTSDLDLLIEVCTQLHGSSPSMVVYKVSRKEIASDNSCLFNAVIYVLGIASNPQQLRREISDIVLSKPDIYTEAFLGRVGPEYSEYIQKPNTWGGEIELSILSEVLQTEIGVVDIQTGNLYTYGENKYDNKVYVLFDGIHYDALYREGPSGFFTTKFSPTDMNVLSQAKELASDLRNSRQFVDVYSFTLMCTSCACRLRGQVEALEHAKATGHTDFGEAR